jgi:hypothetical protein
MSGDCLFRRCTLEKSLQGCSSMSGDFCSRDVRRLFVSQMYSGPWRNHSRGVPACPEVFAPEMYTSPEIFASEMYSREITPGVFQHVQRFLLQRYMSGVFAPEILQRCPEIVCFTDVLWRNHSRGVSACPEVFAPEMYTSPEIFASEMYSGEITPGVFQHVRRFLLGDTCPEFLLQRNHSGSVPTCLESFSLEMYSVEITLGVFSMSGEWRCFLRRSTHVRRFLHRR